MRRRRRRSLQRLSPTSRLLTVQVPPSNGRHRCRPLCRRWRRPPRRRCGFAQTFAFFGGEGGDVDEPDDIFACVAAFVITAPPYDWPTARTGPGISSSTPAI